MSFVIGDTIQVLDLCNEDWFQGQLGGRTGLFPANRIGEITVTPVFSVPLRVTSLPVTPFDDSTPSAPFTATNTKQTLSPKVYNYSDGSIDDIPSDNELSYNPKQQLMPVLILSRPTTPLQDTSKLQSQQELSQSQLVWEQHRDESGKMYFYNTQTQQSSWNPPSSTLMIDSSDGEFNDTENNNHLHSPEAERYGGIRVGLDVLTHISIDYIVTQGHIHRKCIKGYNKSTHHWKLCWAILVPGALILYKQGVSKTNPVFIYTII